MYAEKSREKSHREATAFFSAFFASRRSLLGSTFPAARASSSPLAFAGVIFTPGITHGSKCCFPSGVLYRM